MKAHVNFTITGNLSGQVIPEVDETLTSECGSMLFDSGSDCGSSGSEKPNNEDHKDDKSFQYPSDLLGMSWGSYLHSGPPTRSGDNPFMSRQHHQHASGSPAKRVMVASSTPRQFESGNDSIPADQTHYEQHSEAVVERGPISENRVKKEPDSNACLSAHVVQPRPLFVKLESLVSSLSNSRKELSKYGVETSPLISLSDAAHSAHYDLKQLIAQLGDKKQLGPEILSSGVLHSIIDYLGAVIDGLVAQGKKLNEQAAFLQKTGRQLSRNQQDFLKEQKEVQQALESTREQLLLEKV